MGFRAFRALSYIGIICWSYIGITIGFYWDNGKENGNYYSIIGHILGLRVSSVFWGSFWGSVFHLRLSGVQSFRTVGLRFCL